MVYMGPCLLDTKRVGLSFLGFLSTSIVRRNAENDHCCKFKNHLDYFGHLKQNKHCGSSSSTFRAGGLWFSTSVL